MIDIYLLFIIIAILYVWFDTDAFTEYAALFRLKFTKYEDFFKFRKERLAAIDYHSFLLMRHSNFFTRLITCPLCLAVWANFAVVAATDAKIVQLGLSVILTWLGYFGLKFFIKMFNE